MIIAMDTAVTKKFIPLKVIEALQAIEFAINSDTFDCEKNHDLIVGILKNWLTKMEQKNAKK